MTLGLTSLAASGRSAIGLLVGRLVDLVEDTAVSEELRLSFGPPAELSIRDSYEIKLREACKARWIGRARSVRAVEIGRDELLRLVAVEVLQIFLRHLARPLLVDVAIDQGD